MYSVDFDGKIASLETQTRDVSSSRGGDRKYTLTYRAGHALDCTCLGRRFGHVCIHMKKLQEELDAQQALW